MRSQATLLAIILMRVQVDTADQRLDPLADLRLEQAFTSDEEMALLLSGMSNLAQHLLVKLEQATDATMSEILNDVARQVQQRRAPPKRGGELIHGPEPGTHRKQPNGPDEFAARGWSKLVTP